MENWPWDSQKDTKSHNSKGNSKLITSNRANIPHKTITVEIQATRGMTWLVLHWHHVLKCSIHKWMYHGPNLCKWYWLYNYTRCSSSPMHMKPYLHLSITLAYFLLCTPTMHKRSCKENSKSYARIITYNLSIQCHIAHGKIRQSMV
jgi:hypothetical protein